MIQKVSIHLVLLGMQLHMATIQKLSRLKSDLFYVKSISTIPTLPNMDLPDWSYSKKLLSNVLPSSEEANITIGILEEKIEGNYFARRLGDNCGILTFYQADEILRDANIEVFNYLLLSIYKMVVLYRIGNNRLDEKSWSLVHDETRGCLFDMVGKKYDLIYSAANAHICPLCEAMLAKKNLPLLFTEILKKELKAIRKSRYCKMIEFIKHKRCV